MNKFFEKPLFLALASGIMIGFSYIPGPIFLSWIAFLPFFFILQSNLTTKKKVIYSWIIQFTLTIIGFHWVSHTIIEFGRLPFYFGFLGLIAFASFASLHFCIATFIYDKIFSKKTFASLALFCLLFVLTERFYPMIFPWHMGYTWAAASLPVKQLADTFGFWGLSLLSLFINFFIYYCIFISNKKRIAFASLAILVFALLNYWGYYKKRIWSYSDSSLNFYVAQANIGNLLKYKSAKQGQYIDYIIKEYLDMTHEDLKENPVDIVLWPETAMPIYLNLGRMDSVHSKKIADLARIHKVSIFTGVYSYKDDAVFNSIAHISPEGFVKSIYSKNQLLAFGEYFPGTENNPKFKEWVENIIPAVSHFGRGKGPMNFDYNALIKVGPHVCYEGLDSIYIKEYVDKGANILINVTNDSWFGQIFEPMQHMYMTLARAIEFRRPLVRSTNTGITTAIKANGEILKLSKLGEKKGYIYKMPINIEPENSIYTKIASGLPYFLLVLWLVLTSLIKIKERKNNNAKTH